MKNERIISLKGIFVYILEHWRSIIIGLIVGAVLLGLFGFYKARNAQPQGSSKFDPEAAMEKILAAEAQADAAPMSETERSEVRSAYSGMQNYYESLDYFTVSPYMEFDGSEIFTSSVSGVITPAANDANAAISYSCRQLVNGGGCHSYINDKLGLDIINWERIIAFSDNVNNNSTSSANGVFLITVNYSDEDTCGKIADALVSYLKDNVAELNQQFGTFELKFVSNGTEKIYSSAIINAQRDRRSATQELYDTAVSQIQEFTPKQLDMYVEMLKDFEYDIAEQDELIERVRIYIESQREKSRTTAFEKAMKDAGVTYEDVEKMSQPANVSIKKYVLIGLLLGAVIMICIHAIVYIFANRTDLYDDSGMLYGVSNLGQIPNDDLRKRPFRFIDKWIRSFKNRTFRRSTADAAAMCAADIKMLTEKEGIGKLAFVTCGNEFTSADGSEAVLESLTADKDGTELLVNILNDPASLNRLTEMEGAVIVSKSGKTSRISVNSLVEMMRRQGVNILGSVTVG